MFAESNIRVSDCFPGRVSLIFDNKLDSYRVESIVVSAMGTRLRAKE